MASLTRSNRRAEGLHHPLHLNAHNHNHHVNPLTRPGPAAGLFTTSTSGAGRGGRQKRTLESTDRDIDAIKPKKTRIAVEILAKHQPPVQGVRVQPPPIPRPPTAVPVPNTAAPLTNNTARQPQQPAATTTIKPPIPAISSNTANHAISSAPVAGSTKPTPPEQDASLTKHQAKVINGIKHELDRLQPQAAPAATTRELGRKLRSQEATRFKSDLSAYFPDYDEVIGNDPKEEHVLNLETPIVVVDSNARRTAPETQRGGSKAQQQNRHPLDFPIRGYGDSLYTDVFDSQRIDFRFLETQQNNKNLDDPLPDSMFEPAHKRAERLERSIRNTEKGRAQHEKDQIIRLLEGLQGHDWLRVMGVSGVTETKKKSFEPARAHFIKGCQSILEKFRTWNLEEKRRKLEKERALQAEQQAALAEEEDDDQQESDADQKMEVDSPDDGSQEEEPEQGSIKTEEDEEGDGEDSEEIVTSQSDTSDASPAKQLQQEALARSQMAAANTKKSKQQNQQLPRPTPPRPPETPKEFTSFFSKKYERDNALNRSRRTGRKVLAWGHPLPEIDERDFDLPEEYRDEELLKSRARKKRRDKRGSRP